MKNFELSTQATPKQRSTVETNNSTVNNHDMNNCEDWTRTPTEKPFSDPNPDSRDHTQDQ